MNVADAPTRTARETGPAADARSPIIDCDIHPSIRSIEDLTPFLSDRWKQHIRTYGLRHKKAFLDAMTYPRATPALARGDAWPPDGSPPGSDLAFMQTQHLDTNNVEYGTMHLLTPTGMDQRNQEFAVALCRALNLWQLHAWAEKDPRLKAGIVVPGEDIDAAIKEIEHWAGDSAFVQILLVTHTAEPLGRRKYWKIYEAAAANGLPVGLHGCGENGNPLSGAGWHETYFEFHRLGTLAQQALVSSFVTEGVLSHLPKLKLVIVEGSFAWVPSVGWRLDQLWSRMRDEVPHLTRPPSEYIRENIWFTTQPCDEPEDPSQLRDIIDWIGWDRLLFSSDYPHWDTDDPRYSPAIEMTESERRGLHYENAKAVYDFR